MTLGKKIGAGIGLTLLILGSISSLSYWSLAKLIEQRDEEAVASARIAKYGIGIGTAMAFVLVPLGGFVLVRSITGPVRRLLEGTEKVGRGMLHHRLNIQSRDEIGELAQAFDRMTEKRQ